MPNQTTKKSYVYFPDGAKVEVKTRSDVEYIDVGAISSAVTNTLNWTESAVETANAGALDTRISKMEMAGGFTLINFDLDAIAKMSGGAFSVESTPGTALTDKTAKIPANWEKHVVYPLVLEDAERVRFAAAPTVASVTAESALEAGAYAVVKCDDSSSGYGIMFLDDAQKTHAVTVAISTVTPVASRCIVGGSSTFVLQPYSMRITHVDDNGKKRRLELFCVYSNSGGFQFNFKGANEDGVEEMPITFTSKIDTSRDNGKQLFSWLIEDGAA